VLARITHVWSRFDGFSLRVPAPTVSVVDFTADVGDASSAET
jgi:glyceraldehyde-3-phosphate dehydrogenase/erythrose-4-phosphate dehydrogenase